MTVAHVSKPGFLGGAERGVVLVHVGFLGGPFRGCQVFFCGTNGGFFGI